MEKINTMQYGIHSDSLESQINATLELLGDLGSVLETETKAIRNFDAQTVSSLQDRKVSLGHWYHDAMMALGDRKEDMKQLSEDRKTQIKQAYKEIQGVFDRNLAALKAVEVSSQRMQKLIIDAAHSAVAEDRPTYSASGSAYLSDSEPVHIGTNKTV